MEEANSIGQEYGQLFVIYENGQEIHLIEERRLLENLFDLFYTVKAYMPDSVGKNIHSFMNSTTGMKYHISMKGVIAMIYSPNAPDSEDDEADNAWGLK